MNFGLHFPGRVSGVLALAALGALAGCKPVGPDFERPGRQAPAAYKETGATAVAPPPAVEGGSWKPASPSDGMLRGKWWEVYNDAQLNRLEEQLGPANQKLRAAMESYEAASALIASSRAALYPTFQVGTGYTHQQLSQHRPLASATAKSVSNDYPLTGQVSWAPDFWGRIRRTVEAAGDTAQASAADLATLELSLRAELAQDYFEMRGIDTEASMVESTVRFYEKQLELTERLRASGAASEVAEAQARTQLETTRAQLVDLKQLRAQYEHAIATLLNLEAGQLTLEAAPLDLALPRIPTGMPSQLVERRPDIAAAERRAAAANAQIGVAISAFYPNITLSGSGGFDSTRLSTLFQGPSSLWILGGQATQLLFDAGRRHALTEQARHTYEATAATYKATVLGAFNEVEDRMSDLRILEEESVVQKRAVESAQHSLDLSDRRFKAGVTSYLEVITAENALLTNQRTYTRLQTRQFSASVRLVRALGGGWDTTQLPR